MNFVTDSLKGKLVKIKKKSTHSDAQNPDTLPRATSRREISKAEIMGSNPFEATSNFQVFTRECFLNCLDESKDQSKFLFLSVLFLIIEDQYLTLAT